MAHVKLHIPGPVEVSAKTFQAMTQPMIGHRGQGFKDLYGRIQPQLQSMLSTQQRIYLSTSSAWGVMEGALTNLCTKKVLNCMCGAFSDKWFDVAKKLGKDAEALQVPWGSPIRAEQIDARLATGQFDALTLIHNETSTGTMSPLDEIAALKKKYPDVMFIVDAVSSLTALPHRFDDLGIDQMSFPPFNWNAAPEAPAMPVLAEIASKGVSFRNFWATPECSPSRAAMLTGRHGFRTGVVTAITDPMIPSNQLHPSEVTVPKLLKAAGYTSGMLGKYHLGGGEENTAPGYGYEAPNSALGLDFYQGYWDLPPSVDTTIGGQAADGTYDCGTIGGINVRGAACFPDGSCVENVHPLQAMAMGATPLLKADGTLAATCAEGTCAAVDFTRTNAYYVWPRTATTPTSAGRAKEPATLENAGRPKPGSCITGSMASSPRSACAFGVA